MGRRSRKKTQPAEVDLTPMIDVVFQLLIFFIVTFRIPEVIGRLDVFRPAPDPNAEPETKLDDMIRITVHSRNRFMLNQRWMGLRTIKSNLQRLARVNTRQTVLIQCAEASSHGNLIRVLDICTQMKLVNLSVVTLPPAR